MLWQQVKSTSGEFQWHTQKKKGSGEYWRRGSTREWKVLTAEMQENGEFLFPYCKRSEEFWEHDNISDESSETLWINLIILTSLQDSAERELPWPEYQTQFQQNRKRTKAGIQISKVIYMHEYIHDTYNLRRLQLLQQVCRVSHASGNENAINFTQKDFKIRILSYSALAKVQCIVIFYIYIYTYFKFCIVIQTFHTTEYPHYPGHIKLSGLMRE